jgi:tripartite-type tricarboxylate transporter receptor subunit TctC
MKRRALLAYGGAAALTGAAPSVFAQGKYPQRPVTLVVPTPPGGSTDFTARLIVEPLTRALGQPVIVDNRPGASGNIGNQFVARSKADGYTLLVAYSGYQVGNPHLFKDAGWDPIKDFAPVAMVTRAPQVVAIHHALPVNTLQEFVAYAKKNPGKLNYASSGNGSAPHMAGVLFNSVSDLDILHIPFKGGAPAVQSVIAGDTQVIYGTSPVVLPQVRGGRIRALAITTQERSGAIPGIMGMKEAALSDYDISFSFGLYAPSAMRAEDIKKVFDAAVKVLKRPDIRDKLATQGMDPAPNASPAEFQAQNLKDAPMWAKLVVDSGAKVD